MTIYDWNGLFQAEQLPGTLFWSCATFGGSISTCHSAWQVDELIMFLTGLVRGGFGQTSSQCSVMTQCRTGACECSWQYLATLPNSASTPLPWLATCAHSEARIRQQRQRPHKTVRRSCRRTVRAPVRQAHRHATVATEPHAVKAVTRPSQHQGK